MNLRQTAFFLFVIISGLIACSAGKHDPETQYQPYHYVVAAVLEPAGSKTTFHGVIPGEVSAGSKIRSGDVAGTTVAPPVVVSERFQAQYEKAIASYRANDYSACVSLLDPAIENEKANLFMRNIRAKALYWIDRKRAFEEYEILVQAIDCAKINNYVTFANNGISIETYGAFLDHDIQKLKTLFRSKTLALVLNYWFVEAYWKLGCLYLDRGQYSDAIFQIMRALRLMKMNDSKPMHAQAFSFLSQACFEMDLMSLSEYFGVACLMIHPENTIANKYLKKLPSRHLWSPSEKTANKTEK